MLKRLTESVTSLFGSRDAATLAASTGSNRATGQTPVYHRLSSINKSREMYATDSRIYSAIETLTRDITYGNFSVEIVDGTDVARAQSEVNGLLRRIRLNRLIDEWVRGILVDGEGFILLETDGSAITGASRKEILNSYRITDIEDLFFDFDTAYIRTASILSYNDLANTKPSIPDGSTIYPIESVIYPRLPRPGIQRNGRPLFYSSFASWDRLQEGEHNLSLQRRMRSGYLRHHIITGANQETLASYRANTKDSLDNPNTSVLDLFTNDNIDVKILKGSIDADQIDDIRFHLETVFAASPVPLVLIGYGAGINRDIVEQKLDQYNRSLEAWVEWVDRELVNPIIERQLTLAGLYSDSYLWNVIRPNRTQVKSTELGSLSKAMADLKGSKLFNDAQLQSIFARYCKVDL